SAVLLIGFQNDYFAADGILHQVLESSEQTADVLNRTLELLSSLDAQNVPAISVPILFSADYSELTNPVGLMAQIRDIGAFQRDSSGGAEVPELMALGDRIEHVYGKTGFNAFNGTRLHERLQELGVEHLIVCGVVTSVCIDSTGRAANELGYRVTIVSDCIAGRSAVENEFYCDSVFPLYAELSKSDDLRSDAAG
ncbi:MAG: cysteine hydrolase, partial [Planctomycetota bacterium]|nr:cysteine hydrolase [Planctomycetota bacterium]